MTRNKLGFTFGRLIAVLAVGAMLATTALASAQDAELTDDYLVAIGMTTEELAAVEPNGSWDALGFFSDDARRVLEVASESVETTPYAFGDDISTPPVITPDGTNVVEFGVIHTTVPDGWTPPATGVNGEVAFAQTAAMAAGTDIMMVWTEFDSSFDLAFGLTLNEGVTLAIPGLPVWNSAFEGDTWEGANIIPTGQLVDGVLTFVVNRYDPPQSFTPVAVPAFYYRSGNVMAVGISSDSIEALVAQGAAADENAAAADEGDNRTLLYTGDSSQHTVQSGTMPDWATIVGVGAHGHTSSNLFRPGIVSRIVPISRPSLYFPSNVLLVTDIAPPAAPMPLGFQKQFTDGPVAAGDTVSLEFTIENSPDSPEATEITFTDDLAGGLDGLAATGLPLSDVCGDGSTLSGTTSIELTGGSLLPGQSCTFTTILDVPPVTPNGTFTNTTSPLTAMIGNFLVTSDPGSDALIVESAEEVLVAEPSAGQEPGGGFPWTPATIAGVMIALIVAALKKLRQAQGEESMDSMLGPETTGLRDQEESGVDAFADGTVLEWYARTSEGSAAHEGREGSGGNNFGSSTYTYPDNTIRVETTGVNHRHIEITHPDKTKDVYEVNASWERTDEGDREVFTNSHQRFDAEGNVVETTDWDLVPPPHPWEIAGQEEPERTTVSKTLTTPGPGTETPAPDASDISVPFDLSGIPDRGESGTETLDDGTILERYELLPDRGSSDDAKRYATNSLRRQTYTYPDKTVRVEWRTESHERIEIRHPDGTQDVFERGKKWENTPDGYREVSYDSHTRLDTHGTVVERSGFGDGPPPHPFEPGG